MKPYAFFLDIDGTLLSKNGIPEENKIAIRKAQSRGHFVFLNTGRAYAAISEDIWKSAAFDGVIASLGADIRIRGARIKTERISPETVCALLELFLSMPEENLFLSGEERCFVTNPKFLTGSRVLLESVEDYKETYAGTPVNKFSSTVLADKKVLAPFLSGFTPYYHPTYYEFAIKGCSKSTGMAIAAAHLGVPQERCVAIGDSANDKEMLTAAGIAVVMENGSEDVKELAAFITGNAWEGGVAQAIEKIIAG